MRNEWIESSGKGRNNRNKRRTKDREDKGLIKKKEKLGSEFLLEFQAKIIVYIDPHDVYMKTMYGFSGVQLEKFNLPIGGNFLGGIKNNIAYNLLSVKGNSHGKFGQDPSRHLGVIKK